MIPAPDRSKQVVIIGVIGKSHLDASNRDNQALLFTAHRIGQLIAQRGAIVLTGGHHAVWENSVKHYALLGALAAANYGLSARLIGILPEAISSMISTNVDRHVECIDLTDPKRCCVYVHTQLESSERDVKTGATVDVMIALRGRSGTSREAAATLKAKRPVVFLNSWRVLERAILEQMGDQNSVSEAREARRIVEVSSAGEAVDQALTLADLTRTAVYPDDPDTPKDPVVVAAREAIERLRRS